MSSDTVEADRSLVATALGSSPDIDTVAGFVAGPGIVRLELKFDIGELRNALDEVRTLTPFDGEYAAQGFGVIALTRRPGVEQPTANDMSGRYWLRADDRYVEEPHEDKVDESAFTEFVPMYSDTYFAHVHQEFSARFPIGRMRLLSKDLYNCNSWHRDPEPRVHLPIIANPGSLFIVNNHCTHLPADGSTYFTDTRGYHTALNGGLHERVHLVAAIPLDPGAPGPHS